MNEFAVDGDSGLGGGYGDERGGLDHNVLVVDLDVRSLLGIGADKKKSAATKRRAAIKYSDKKRVERFREYATNEFARRDLDGALTELIGGLALDAALRDRGRTERELDEGAPWEALRWQRRWDPGLDDGTLRWRASTALAVLGAFAPTWLTRASSPRTGERIAGVGRQAPPGGGTASPTKPSTPRQYYTSAPDACPAKFEQVQHGRLSKHAST